MLEELRAQIVSKLTEAINQEESKRISYGSPFSPFDAAKDYWTARGIVQGIAVALEIFDEWVTSNNLEMYN